MTKAEILLYNLGWRLHAEAAGLIVNGHGVDLPRSAILTAEESASVQRLGEAEALRLMRMGATDQVAPAPGMEGGREPPVTAKRMAVPPSTRPAT